MASSLKDTVASSPVFSALVNAASEAKKSPEVGPVNSEPLFEKRPSLTMTTLKLSPPSTPAAFQDSPGLRALSTLSLQMKSPFALTPFSPPSSGAQQMQQAANMNNHNHINAIQLQDFELPKPRQTQLPVPKKRTTSTRKRRKTSKTSNNENQQKTSVKRNTKKKDNKIVRKKSNPAPKPPATGGSSCHQCKSRRNTSDLTYCTASLDNKKKHCRKKYCDHCLKKFYKESAATILDKSTWACPSCRRICCCAACRRRDQKQKDQNKFNDNKQSISDKNQHILSTHNSTNRKIKRQKKNSYKKDEDMMEESFGATIMETDSSNNQQSNDSSAFALLYTVAQVPNVKKHIQYILARKDITDQQKVESIATLLRGSAREQNAVVDN